MRNIFIYFALCSLMPAIISAQELFGSWVNADYNVDFPANYLDMITIVKINEDEAIIQHTFYREPEDSYFIQAELANGKITYVDPITGWLVHLEISNTGRFLNWYPDFDKYFVSNYQRPDQEFFNFLGNIDSFIENAQYLDGYE